MWALPYPNLLVVRAVRSHLIAQLHFIVQLTCRHIFLLEEKKKSRIRRGGDTARARIPLRRLPPVFGWILV